MDTEQVVTLEKAAELIGVTRQTLYNWIKAGKVVPMRFLNKPYLPMQVVNQLIKKARG